MHYVHWLHAWCDLPDDRWVCRPKFTPSILCMLIKCVYHAVKVLCILVLEIHAVLCVRVRLDCMYMYVWKNELWSEKCIHVRARGDCIRGWVFICHDRVWKELVMNRVAIKSLWLLFQKNDSRILLSVKSESMKQQLKFCSLAKARTYIHLADTCDEIRNIYITGWLHVLNRINKEVYLNERQQKQASSHARPSQDYIQLPLECATR
jgi:hypothetical protein